jgi:putative transposase
VTLRFIPPDKRDEKEFVERFNGNFHEDCLDAHRFEDLGHARRVIGSWRLDYNDAGRT